MLFATAGMKIEIGGQKSMKSVDFTEADFDAEDWTEITGHENLGQLGDASEEITQELIGEARMKRLKGTRSSPPMELILAINYDDDGQQEIIAAEKTPNDYAFRLTFNDAPPDGTPSERMFIAKVASVTEQFDTANNVMKLNATLWVNSNVVRVDATEAA